jgi:hypothetical protein
MALKLVLAKVQHVMVPRTCTQPYFRLTLRCNYVCVASVAQLLLPLLRCKLPSELTCLEQVLLLQAQHQQPVLPAVQPAVSSSTPPGPPSATASHDARYTTRKQQLLQHWFAPQRYAQLNQLERLLLAALEGQEALLQYSRDLMQQLQKQGVKRTW